MNTRTARLTLCALLAASGTARAQSLFRQPPAPKAPGAPFPGGTPAGPDVRGQTPATSNPAQLSPQEHAAPASAPHEVSLKQASLMFIEAPHPRTYEVHDIVTIIIAENSSQSSEQKLDAKKDAALKAAVNKFPDIALLLQANLTNTSASTPIGSVDLTGSKNFKGDGKFERYDRFTDRITAKVIDVKGYRSDDGERLTIVRWENEETMRQWREHARHRVAQQTGRTRWYEYYKMDVAEIVRQKDFVAAAPTSLPQS